MDLVTTSRSRTTATFKMECFVIIVNGWKLLTIITKHSILIAATFKMERFVIIVNGWMLLTIIAKCSILDVAAGLGPLLVTFTLPWFFLLFLRFVVEITLFKIVGKIYRLSCLY